MDVVMIVRVFQERFPHLAEQKVILYGLGQVAAVLTTRLDEMPFEVVGVLDRERRGGFFNGLPVLTPEAVPPMAGHIIITAALKHCYEIHRRIAWLETAGVKIYFPNGRCYTGRNAGYYLQSIGAGLYDKIHAAEVISFDLFDTLVMRTCLTPTAVFDLLEAGLALPGLAETRQSLAALCAKISPHYTLEELYSHGHRLGLLPDNHGTIMESEMDLEERLCVSRPDMVRAFNYARDLGRTVIVTSDMHLPRPRLEAMAARCGLEGFEAMLVSSELKAAKWNGGIWPLVKERYPNRRILHIGDNWAADYLNPVEHGLQAHPILPPLEILELLGCEKKEERPLSIYDHMAAGLLVRRVMSLAGSTPAGREAIALTEAEDLGYLFLGPVTFSYTQWVLETAVANGDEKLLFLARDCFPVARFYEKIQSARPGPAPSAVYFQLSRRAVAGASIQTPHDLRQALGRYGHWALSMAKRERGSARVADVLAVMLGLDFPDDEYGCQDFAGVETGDLFERLMADYWDVIAQQAAIRRENYLKYMRSAGVSSEDQLGVVDLQSQSFTFLDLAKVANLCFNSYLYTHYRLTDGVDGSRIFVHKPLSCDEMDTAISAYFAGSHYLASLTPCELFFYTSPEGSLLHFDRDGCPVKQADERQNHQAIADTQRGAELFLDDLLSGPVAAYGPLNSHFTETVFDALGGEFFCLGESLKSKLLPDKADGYLLDRLCPNFQPGE